MLPEYPRRHALQRVPSQKPVVVLLAQLSHAGPVQKPFCALREHTHVPTLLHVPPAPQLVRQLWRRAAMTVALVDAKVRQRAPPKSAAHALHVCPDHQPVLQPVAHWHEKMAPGAPATMRATHLPWPLHRTASSHVSLQPGPPCVPAHDVQREPVQKPSAIDAAQTHVPALPHLPWPEHLASMQWTVHCPVG